MLGNVMILPQTEGCGEEGYEKGELPITALERR